MLGKRQHGRAWAWLGATALSAAITAILNRILTQLWADGWQLGRDSAGTILGEELAADEQELDRVLAQAGDRIPGMVETRLAQIETILDGAAPDTTAEELEAELEDAIGSVPRALAVTQTETTWSMAEGMLGAYYQMGVTTMGWLTAEDERVCPICDDNGGEGYIPAGQPFASGDTQPPAHPLCRCCLIPGDIGGTPLPYRGI